MVGSACCAAPYILLHEALMSVSSMLSAWCNWSFETPSPTVEQLLWPISSFARLAQRDC